MECKNKRRIPFSENSRGWLKQSLWMGDGRSIYIYMIHSVYIHWNFRFVIFSAFRIFFLIGMFGDARCIGEPVSSNLSTINYEADADSSDDDEHLPKILWILMWHEVREHIPDHLIQVIFICHRNWLALINNNMPEPKFPYCMAINALKNWLLAQGKIV